MRRNMNEDEFLYDVSEESILKDWNMGTEAPDHEFSEKYKEFRQELIYRAEKGQSGSDCRETEENRMDTADIIPMKPKRKRFFKTPVGVGGRLCRCDCPVGRSLCDFRDIYSEGQKAGR